MVLLVYLTRISIRVPSCYFWPDRPQMQSTLKGERNTRQSISVALTTKKELENYIIIRYHHLIFRVPTFIFKVIQIDVFGVLSLWTSVADVSNVAAVSPRSPLTKSMWNALSLFEVNAWNTGYTGICEHLCVCLMCYRTAKY